MTHSDTASRVPSRGFRKGTCDAASQRPWRPRLAITSSRDSSPGACARSSGTPVTASTAILAALDRAKNEIRFIQVRHEEIRRVHGVRACEVHRRGRRVHGDLGARARSTCSTASTTRRWITSRSSRSSGRARAPRSAPTTSRKSICVSLFKDVAHNYVHTCMVPAQARHLIDRAMRIAFAERTVTCVIVPNDVQELRRRRDAAARAQHDADRHRLPSRRARAERLRSQRGRRDPQCRRSGRRSSSVRARSAPIRRVLAVADRLGAGIAKALLGKAVVPDDLPFVTGPMGLLGSKASDEMMEHCDTLFMIGSSFPYVEFLPKEGKVKAVQIDIAPRNAVAALPDGRRARTAMRATRCARCCRISTRRRTAHGASRSRSGRATGGRSSRSARTPTPIRSTRSACSGSCRLACPTARSSPRIPARRPAGGRATSCCATA